MSNLPTDFQHRSTNIETAYTVCLLAETKVKGLLRRATTKTEITRQEKNLADVRILGYLLLEGSDAAKAHIAKSIHSLGPQGQGQGQPGLTRPEDVPLGEIIELGGFFFTYFIRAFRRSGGRTPAPSRHPSRPSFDTVQQAIEELITEAPQNHLEAKKSALCRDGFRCAISRVLDLNYEPRLPGVQSDESGGITQCAHIIPEVLNYGLDNPTKSGHAANVWTVLQYFGTRGVHPELLGRNIHRIENIMTLDSPIHHYFDTLRFWLESTNIPHRYRIRYLDPFNPKRLRYDLSDYVELTTPDANRLPLPNPDYLALHASCCRVAHLSGAAGFLEWMDDQKDSFGSPVPSGDLSATLTARLLFLETQSSGNVAVSS